MDATEASRQFLNGAPWPTDFGMAVTCHALPAFWAPGGADDARVRGRLDRSALAAQYPIGSRHLAAARSAGGNGTYCPGADGP